MAHIRIFLEWEVKFQLDYLNGSLSKFKSEAPFLTFLINEQYPVTVNHYRKELGYGPHPDPARGILKVWEDDPGTQPGDADIPSGLCRQTFEGLIAAQNSKEQDRKSREDIIAEFPLLAQKAIEEGA